MRRMGSVASGSHPGYCPAVRLTRFLLPAAPSGRWRPAWPPTPSLRPEHAARPALFSSQKLKQEREDVEAGSEDPHLTPSKSPGCLKLRRPRSNLRLWRTSAEHGTVQTGQGSGGSWRGSGDPRGQAARASPALGGGGRPGGRGRPVHPEERSSGTTRGVVSRTLQEPFPEAPWTAPASRPLGAAGWLQVTGGWALGPIPNPVRASFLSPRPVEPEGLSGKGTGATGCLGPRGNGHSATSGSFPGVRQTLVRD